MPFYKSLVDDNPIVAAGAKRRAATDADLYTSTPVDTVDPYKGQWGAETIRSQAQRLGNYVPALSGLGRQLLGDDAGAQKDYADFAKGEETARELGPAVQSFADAKKAGGGVGDYLSAIGYQGASFLPDAALAVAGGGIGGEVAGGMARRAATRALANEIEDRSVNVAARAAAKDAAAKAAAAAPDAVQGVGNAIRVANAQVDEAGRKAAMEGAAEIAGRTPRIVSDVQRAQKLGSVVGSAAGFYPATVSSSVDFLKDHPGQEAAAKVAGVDAAASLIGSLPFGHALEGLAPAAKEAAGQVIAKDAQRFLPKLVQGTALHAAGGGAAGAAMTATQLAGHKWVDDNIDLLSDDAKEKYLDSFIGGAIAGGAFHAGPAVAGKVRSAIADRLGAAGDKAGAFKEYAKGVLQSYADKVRALHAKQDAARPQPGDEIPLNTPDGGAGSNVLDLLRRGKDAVAGVASKATEAGKSAFDRFTSHKDALHQDSAIDDSVNALHDEFVNNGAKIPGRLRSADQNPITGLGGLRDHAMSYIPKDSPVWMDKTTANYVASTLERVLTGKEPTAKDASVLDALTESGSLHPHTLEAMKIVGAQRGEVLRQAADLHEETKAAADEPPAENGVISPSLADEIKAKLRGEPEPDAMRDSDAETQRQVEGEGDIVNDAMSERGKDAVDAPIPLGERVANTFIAARDAGRRVREATTPEAKAAAIAERRDANKAHIQARGELRDHLFGEKTYKNPYGKNIINERIVDPGEFDKKAAQPGRVVITDTGTFHSRNKGAVPLRLALSIDSLAAKEIGQNSEAYQNLEPAARGKAAFIRVLGDLAQAGIKVKPESITAGDLGKVGDIYLGKLTEGDVADLRGMVRSGVGKNFELRNSAPSRVGPGRDPAERAGNLIEPSMRDRVQGTEELADQDLHKLAPREAPTGRRSAQGDFVPDEGVSDVVVKPSTESAIAEAARADVYRRIERPARRSSAAKEVAREGATRETAALKVGQDAVDSRPISKRSDPRFKAGVEIGERQLRAAHEVHGNDRRLAESLARLNDPDTGMAARYYADALKGKFDTGRVVEKKADHEKIDREALREEDGGEPTHLDEAGVESAAKDDGPHDHVAETKMLNEVLGRLGIESRVHVIPLRPKRGPQIGGEYSARTMTVAINDNLHGSERVAVLTHELGHHIIYATLAKELGIDHIRMGRITSEQALDMLAKSNPELHKAMLADYAQWRAEQLKGNPRVLDVRSSRSPFARSVALQQRGAFDGKRMGDLSPQGRETVLDAHEWLADNIAKALNSKAETQSIIGKFFSKVATALREAYAMVFDVKALAKYKPAESVDKWVQSLFDANIEGVREATGASVPADAAASVVEAAAAVEGASRFNPNDMSDMAAYAKQFGEYVRTVLPLEERQILDRVLNRASSVKVLRTFADGNPVLLALLDDAARGLENRVMLGFMAWKGGKLKTGTEGGNAFAQVGDNLAKIFGATGEGDLAQRVFNDIASGAVQRFHDANKTYSVRELEARSRGNVQRALNWVNKRGKVGEATSKFLEGSKSRLWHSGVPAAREFLTRIQRPQGTTRDELLGAKLPAGEGLTPSLVHTLAKYEKATREAIGHLSRKQQVTVLDMLQRQMTPEHPKWAVKSQAARDATLAVRKIMDQSYNYLREAGVKVGRRDNFFPVVIDLRNEAAKKSLFDLYNQPEKFEKTIREFFGTTERESKDAAGNAERTASYPGVDPKALDYFAKKRDEWAGRGKEHVAQTNQSILDAISKGNIRTIERQIASSEKRQEKYESQAENPSAELMNAFELERRYMRARIKQLRDAGVGEESPTYTGEKPTAGPGKRVPSDLPFEELVQKLVDGAIEEHGFSTAGSDTPNFRGMNHRVSNFIYTHGDAKDVRAFANLQSKNAADVFARYLGPMVKRAEYARHFGANGEVKTKLFDDMRKQGATEDQVAEADNVLKAALGTYGAEGSPVLNMISPALAKRLHTKATRDVVSGAQAYQNTRLLPLALLSSLVDPMGIAVRTGGDFGLMWQGFKGGMKALTDKATREELHGMLEQLGAANDTLFILQSGFGGSSDHTVANKVNEFVFRMNGMESWVTNTRYQALLAAHGFLLKHAGGNASPHSQRYMQELQLQPGDVRSEIQQRPDGKQVQRVALLTDAQRKAASSEEVARDDRVRNALRTFVDDAILRPNSTQRPLWHNDPYMGLLTQYKAFGYAIYDQIAGRLSREMQHGNMKVMNAALAYVPIVILSEMIRGVLQYGAGGNPNRDDWGPGDYLAMGVQRSGLPGPTVNFLHDVKGDLDRKNLPGSSQLGPTIGQLSNAADALEGRRDLGKEFESALPGSAAYQHLDDESVTNPKRKAA